MRSAPDGTLPSRSSPPPTNGPITEPARLAALGRWQRRIAELPGVQAVIGPGQVGRRVAPLREGASALLASEGKTGPFGQLGNARPQAGSGRRGVAQLREGLSQASAGAGLLCPGIREGGERGGGDLARPRGRHALAAGGRSRRLIAFAKGTRRLAAAQQKAAFGSLQLKLGLRDEASNLRVNALRRAHERQKSHSRGMPMKSCPELIAPAKVADEQLRLPCGSCRR